MDDLDYIAGTYEGKKILICYDLEANSGILAVTMPKFGIEYPDEIGNATILSAGLRSHLSYQACCELLIANNIPFEHPLWHLNHSGPPGRKLN